MAYDRAALVKELSRNFANASGTGRVEHGVSQWDLCAEALVKAIEGIVRNELQGVPQDPGSIRVGDTTPGLG